MASSTATIITWKSSLPTNLCRLMRQFRCIRWSLNAMFAKRSLYSRLWISDDIDSTTLVMWVWNFSFAKTASAVPRKSSDPELAERSSFCLLKLWLLCLALKKLVMLYTLIWSLSCVLESFWSFHITRFFELRISHLNWLKLCLGEA